MTTDPIADLLTIVKNGYLARKQTVSLPHSKMKKEIAKILAKEGYLKELKVVAARPRVKYLLLTLKYEGKKPALTWAKRVSKPGLRVYVSAGKIPYRGIRLTLISTPQGLMTGREARKKNLGGEIICQLW